MLDLDIRLEPGTKETVQRKVAIEDAALNYGSGQLDTMLATPSLVALMIEAAVQLIEPKLPEGYLSVGKSLEITHTHATGLGVTVTVEAILDAFDGTNAEITAIAYDELGEIGRGHMVRVVVNRDSMLARAHKRAEDIANKNF